MARKKAVQQNELLLPSVALSMIVLVLVGALVTVLSQSKTPETSASASQGRSRMLTRDNQVDDLESDLLLLQEDTLDSELSVLETIK